MGRLETFGCCVCVWLTNSDHNENLQEEGFLKVRVLASQDLQILLNVVYLCRPLNSVKHPFFVPSLPVSTRSPISASQKRRSKCSIRCAHEHTFQRAFELKMIIDGWLPPRPCQQMATVEQLVDPGHLLLRDDARDGQLSSGISIPFPRDAMTLGC